MQCGNHLAQRLSSDLKEELGTTDVLIDAPPPHREIEINIDIYYAKEQVYRPLHEVSPVVDALARTQFDDYVKRVRIFAHPRIAPKLREFSGFAETLKETLAEMSGSET